MRNPVRRSRDRYLSARGRGSIATDQGSSLKATVQFVPALKRFQQLKGGIAHLIAGAGELLRLLNGEPNTFHHYPQLSSQHFRGMMALLTLGSSQPTLIIGKRRAYELERS